MSKATAIRSGCSSPKSLINIDVNPYTAFVTVPGARREGLRECEERPVREAVTVEQEQPTRGCAHAAILVGVADGPAFAAGRAGALS